MKKIIFLIISSHNQPIYHGMRTTIRLYIRKMQSKYDLKCFFVESKKLDDNEMILKDDVIYVNNIESVATTIKNTHVAFKFINTHYDYDIIIRSNLSSFWNIPNLFNTLEPIQNKNIAMGFYYTDFIGGYCIILSKDVCIKLCEILKYSDYEPLDDVLISRHLQTFIEIQSLPLDKILHVIEETNHHIPDDISNYIVFRIKSFGTRVRDKNTFIKLAKRIYDITIDDSIF